MGKCSACRNCGDKKKRGIPFKELDPNASFDRILLNEREMNSREKSTSFHRFPLKNPALTRAWVDAMKKKDWWPKKNSLLCGEHFTESCFLKRPNASRMALKPDAVPTIFSFPVNGDNMAIQQERTYYEEPHASSSKNARCDGAQLILGKDGYHQVPGMAVGNAPHHPVEVPLTTDGEPQESSMIMDLNKDAVSRSVTNDNYESPPIAGVDGEYLQEASLPTQMDVEALLFTNVDVERLDSSVQVNLPLPLTKKLKQEVQNLKAKLHRRDSKIAGMKSIIQDLKKNHLCTAEVSEWLENNYSSFPVQFLFETLKNAPRTQGRRYSEQTKIFSLTLRYYSPMAYNYLRTIFCLPHPRLISSWVCSVNAEPGILSTVLSYLKINKDERPYLKDVGLIFDSMSIRSQISYDMGSKKISGYVDLGKIVAIDCEKPATEAFVVQVVSLSQAFKCPIAYFFVDKMSSDMLSTIISTVIYQLHSTGIQVRSVTCDGISSNIAALKSLGCNIKEGHHTFPHPDGINSVFVFLDPCHMLKLARNCFAQKKMSSIQGEILWTFISRLANVQEQEGLKLANKLSGKHVHFRNKVMNVQLAAQTLSGGVADALDFLRSVHYPGFAGSEATVNFIRLINLIFDILNCRNPFGKSFKQPITPKNLAFMEQQIESLINDLNSLLCDGVPLFLHERKTFVLGFICSLKSAVGLARALFNKPEPLRYFLTYKISQDHLELFFGTVRRQNGWNNNPNTLQFKASMKKLLLHNAIRASERGNSIDFDGEKMGSIVEFRSCKRSLNEHQGDDILDVEALQMGYLETSTEIRSYIIYYIAGYLVRSIRSMLTCEECSEVLKSTENVVEHNYCKKKNYELDHDYSRPAVNPSSFTKYVDRGGLIMPANWVFEVCVYTDKLCTLFLENFQTARNPVSQIANRVNKYFTLVKPLGLKHSVTNFLIEELHESQLIKLVASKYCQLMMHVHGKRATMNMQHNRSSVRQRLNKLILFKHC